MDFISWYGVSYEISLEVSIVTVIQNGNSTKMVDHITINWNWNQIITRFKSISITSDFMHSLMKK